jgi:hypothetical protein
MGLAPLLLRPAPFHGVSLLFGAPEGPFAADPAFPFADIRLTPHYPSQSPLADILRLVPPGSDNYPTEKYAFEIESQLRQWSESLKTSARDLSSLAKSLDASIQASLLVPSKEVPLRSGYGIDIVRRRFDAAPTAGRERFLESVQAWLGMIARVATAEFEIYAIEQIGSSPLAVAADIRYDIAASRPDDRREERVGSWHTEWSRLDSGVWKARRWQTGEETLSIGRETIFVDVSSQAIGHSPSYKNQLLHGVDYWRTVLDNACAIDLYNNTGVAAGDFDNDGFDDFYVCQPAGLPNRLYRNRGDGTFEDVTERSGVGVLDNTACALFADWSSAPPALCSSSTRAMAHSPLSAMRSPSLGLRRDHSHTRRSPTTIATAASISTFARTCIISVSTSITTRFPITTPATGRRIVSCTTKATQRSSRRRKRPD